jgi:hypothetical protein
MDDKYLNMLLLTLLGNQDLVNLWWFGPNKAFDGKCPKDVPDEEVRKYLERYYYGP